MKKQEAVIEVNHLAEPLGRRLSTALSRVVSTAVKNAGVGRECIATSQEDEGRLFGSKPVWCLADVFKASDVLGMSLEKLFLLVLQKVS